MMDTAILRRLLTSAFASLAASSTGLAVPPATQPLQAIIQAQLLDSHLPAPNIKIYWQSPNLEGSAQTNPAGQITLPNFPDSLPWLALRATAPNMVPQFIYWDRPPVGPATLPALPHFIFLMEKSTTISGHVLDDVGHPIPHAKVFLQVRKKYPNSDQRPDLNWKSTTSDPQGLFSFSNLPPHPDKIELGGYDLLHLTNEHFFLQPYTPQQSLYDGTAKLTFPSACNPIDVTVLKPDGSPAPSAKVFLGRDNHVVNCIAPASADQIGQVHFAVAPGLITLLTASLPGFGPAQSPLTVSKDPQHLTLQLSNPTPRSLEIVDSAGLPIPNVTIHASTWRRASVLSPEIKTDSAGRATWNDGPPDSLTIDLYADTYMGKSNFPWNPGPTRLTLTRPTPITALVLDSQTNQPIKNFTLRTAVIWDENDSRMIWQPKDILAVNSDPATGSFQSELTQPAYRYFLQVTADGHLPADTSLIIPDGSPKSFTLRLDPAPNLTGQLLTADNHPIPSADIYLVLSNDSLGLQNAAISQGMDDSPHFRSDPTGHFSLPPQKDDFALQILSDYGSATLTRRDLSANTPILLIPWSQLHGTLSLNGKPAPDLQLSASSDSTSLDNGNPIISRRYFLTTNKDGSFNLPRVFPGPLILSREVPNHSPGRTWSISLASPSLEPGQSLDLQLGTASSLTGQLLIPPNKQWMIRQSRLELTGHPHQEDFENIEVLDDGRFRAENLQPGDYHLHVALHEFPPNNSCGWGRLVAEFDKDLSIPSSPKVIDIGSLAPNPILTPDLNPGDLATDFAVKNFDGQTQHLSDLKGKVVLLDFWASWCAPCVAEIPNLQKIHAAYANNPNFAMLSLNLEEKETDAQRIVKLMNMPWPQAWLDINSSLVRTYGATAIPATYLIGRDGRILSRNLRGQELTSAIDSALNEKK